MREIGKAKIFLAALLLVPMACWGQASQGIQQQRHVPLESSLSSNTTALALWQFAIPEDTVGVGKVPHVWMGTLLGNVQITGLTGATGPSGPNYPFAFNGTPLTSAPASVNVTNTGTGAASLSVSSNALTLNIPLFTLPSVGTAGTYAYPSSVTTDANGRVTSVTAGSAPTNGTVTSVGLSLPSLFSVSGSPVTTSGTLSAALASQSANLGLFSPDGAAGVPTFRGIVGGDLAGAGISSDGTHVGIGTTFLSPYALNLTTARVTGTITSLSTGVSLAANGTIGSNSVGSNYLAGTLSVGSSTTDSTTGLTVSPPSTTGVGLNAKALSGQTGNLINVSSSTGTGDLLSLDSSGTFHTYSYTKPFWDTAASGTADISIGAQVSPEDGTKKDLYIYGGSRTHINTQNLILDGGGTLVSGTGTLGISSPISATAQSTFSFQTNLNNTIVFQGGSNVDTILRPYGISNAVVVRQATTGQTRNTQEWQTSASGVMASVSNVGNITTPAVLTAVRTVSASTTLLSTDTFLLDNGANTITLPSPTGLSGHVWTIKEIGTGLTANVVPSTGTPTPTIDGSSSYSLAGTNKYVTILTDGLNFFIVANN